MRTATALDVRRRFGQILDEAAAGERIVIERAGQPVAALVPLADLEVVDPERRRARRLAAIDDIERLARRRPFPARFDPVAAIRAGRAGRDERDERDERGAGGARDVRPTQPG
jgi:prevent-host-death family protein